MSCNLQCLSSQLGCRCVCANFMLGNAKWKQFAARQDSLDNGWLYIRLYSDLPYSFSCELESHLLKNPLYLPSWKTDQMTGQSADCGGLISGPDRTAIGERPMQATRLKKTTFEVAFRVLRRLIIDGILGFACGGLYGLVFGGFGALLHGEAWKLVS